MNRQTKYLWKSKEKRKGDRGIFNSIDSLLWGGAEKKDYSPIVFELPEIKDSIFKYKVHPQFSVNIDYPKFSLGFHHYIHQNKDKMIIKEQFKNKKKVYLVINKFERYVDDYKESIGYASKKYFNLEGKPDILSRAFYKLWEIFYMFDLIDLDKKNFRSAHLAEGPGSFIQATMFFRDKYSKQKISKTDNYYAITLHPEDIKKHVPALEKKFIDFYKKEKPVRFLQHRTYSRNVARQSKNKDNGDLTNPKTIKLFTNKIGKDKVDLVTADGGFDWKNENTQEQEAFKLILAEIVTALRIQAKGGNFVCKLFESFTMVTVKFMLILSSAYDKVYLTKPLMSRKSNSEKYLVCMNYKGISDRDIDELEKILKQSFGSKNKNLVDLYPDYQIPKDYLGTVIKSNTSISNKQFQSINQIVDFINGQNYRGDLYQDRRNKQIDASKYWIDRFFPDSSKFSANKELVKKNTQEIIKQNLDLVSKFNQEIKY